MMECCDCELLILSFVMNRGKRLSYYVISFNFRMVKPNTAKTKKKTSSSPASKHQTSGNIRIGDIIKKNYVNLISCGSSPEISLQDVHQSFLLTTFNSQPTRLVRTTKLHNKNYQNITLRLNLNALRTDLTSNSCRFRQKIDEE